MKRTKLKRILAFILATVMICFILIVANSAVGNPISKIICKNSAKKYLELNYAGENFEIESITYDFKFSDYWCRVKSKTSPDKQFTILLTPSGDIKSDDYEFRIGPK